MEQTGFDGIAFADTLQDFNTLHYAGQIVHIATEVWDLLFKIRATTSL